LPSSLCPHEVSLVGFLRFSLRWPFLVADSVSSPFSEILGALSDENIRELVGEKIEGDGVLPVRRLQLAGNS